MDDVARLERLHRDHAAAVRAYVRRRIDPADADDVISDVFLVAWRRIGELPDEPRSWLLAVARRTLANRRRSASRQRALYERLAAVATRRPVIADVPAADGAALRALAALSPRDREALLLVTWDGLAHAQAAAVLGLRPNTFTKRVTRARRRFEQALEQAARARPRPGPRPAPSTAPVPEPPSTPGAP